MRAGARYPGWIAANAPTASFHRDPPDVRALLDVLDAHGVRYVVTGSVAAFLHGVALVPSDLDVTPALDRDNLERLARALDELGAQRYPDEPFGQWELGDDGERHWAQFEPTDTDRQARAQWRPDPANVGSFDHLLRTRHGTLDVVTEIAGTYEALRPRAVAIEINGRHVWVESVTDQLATLTVPRRKKDLERVRALRAVQATLDIADPS